MESIGKRLKRLRLKMGISQEEASKLLQVRRETIGRWERELNVPQKICESMLEAILNNWENLIAMSDKL